MSLRLRLLAIIGLSFTLLWSAVSIWMFIDLRQEFRDTLDERLAASARMVGGLISQLPSTQETPVSAPHGLLAVASRDGVACEIRLLHGGLVARTRNTPEGLGNCMRGRNKDFLLPFVCLAGKIASAMFGNQPCKLSVICAQYFSSSALRSEEHTPHWRFPGTA